MNKVALHEYEKAVKRQKWLGKVDTIVKWFGISLMLSIPLGALGVICLGLWVAGVGWLGPIVVALIAGLLCYACMADKNDEILKDAQQYGTIDE